MKAFGLLFGLSLFCGQQEITAQQRQKSDSLPSKTLENVTIHADIENQTYMPDIAGTILYAGKKTGRVVLKPGEANLTKNLGRTIFAKLPGVNLWDMDGAGTQMNIGTRGTDAHRSIEMNMRQNGYNTNSDMFGYPENHYTVAMQGVKEIQLIRGAASLQFGSQFGGMMNYVMKSGDRNKSIGIESRQTIGSNGLFNSFNAIGGTIGKVRYYAFYNNRHGDGWRPNAAFNYQSFYANLTWELSKKSSLSFQFSQMDYWQQIAGGLTDEMFANDPRQSNRSRNYFSPEINIPALIFNSQLSNSTTLNITANAIWGNRSSVQFITTPDVEDTVNSDLGSYNPRQVDRDFYRGFTTEIRLLHHYVIGKMKNTLATGIRYSNERTKRRQKGSGTTGNDLDFSVQDGYGIDIKFNTVNYAAFIENIFQISPEFSVTPGMRYEVIKSSSDGVIDDASFPVSYAGNRSFPLFGLGLEYKASSLIELYANVSQAYRPFLYAYITPADQIGVIDPDLKDSKGYSMDLGFRGQYRDILNWDANLFYLFYGDRIGKLTMMDDNDPYLYTTNVGNSVAKGAEAYVRISLFRLLDGPSSSDLSLFNSLAYTHARYTSGEVSEGGQNVSLEGNQVAGVPDWINRIGLTFTSKHFTSTLQLSHVSSKFNDASNTVFNPTAATGCIPSYTLLDWSFEVSFTKKYSVSGGINNLGDQMYFSRRINTYPGPGILPGEGRTYHLSFGIKI